MTCSRVFHTNHNMCKYIVPILCLLFPVTATAENVAVLPVSYKIYRTAAQSSDRASKVQDAVGKAIEKIGMTATFGAAVQDAAQSVSPNGAFSCTDDECLKSVAEKTGADFGVVVSVVDNDGQFDIKVFVTDAEPAAASPFGTFGAMIKRVSGMVESALKEAKERKEAAAAPPEETIKESETPPSEEITPAVQSETPVPPSSSPDLNTKKKPISKIAFFTTLGVTVGLGAAYGAVEGIGYAKMKNLEEQGTWTADEKKTVENMQLTSRILLGALGVGVITSIILVPFTNFKGTSKKVAVTPSFTTQSGGMLIQGEF